MKPDVFVNSTVNGSFNASFFTTRFKEALFHYTAVFDMFGSTLSRENPERMHFEEVFYGREVMNVIACEGVDRVERPETYKQWQVRMMRAGFKQKPVEAELVESFRVKMKKWGYHKDFVLDEDSNWFLQGQMEDAGAHNKNITATKERYRSWGSNGSCLLVPATGKTTVARGTQKLETTLGL
ncbi:hypothetical protein F2Q70_00042007 [Brassica cretica]|uniref:Uncharacterized protein n=1 Tax=Brassica cretica TaxID=69181 RepID=A0A8S9K627_BRACR|nr:hypothetical protein F2Q70_00042007 [Brassica cretica]